MTEQNSLLMAKVDALAIAAQLPSRMAQLPLRISVDPDELETFARTIKAAPLKRETIVADR